MRRNSNLASLCCQSRLFASASNGPSARLSGHASPRLNFRVSFSVFFWGAQIKKTCKKLVQKFEPLLVPTEFRVHFRFGNKNHFWSHFWDRNGPGTKNGSRIGLKTVPGPKLAHFSEPKRPQNKNLNWSQNGPRKGTCFFSQKRFSKMNPLLGQGFLFLAQGFYFWRRVFHSSAGASNSPFTGTRNSTLV